MPDASFADLDLPLLRRFPVLWRLKLGATVVVNLCFWTVYLVLSHHHVFPLHQLPAIWIDTWVEYQPHPWAWIYESIFLLTGIIPWMTVTREQLRRYILGFTLLSVGSFACFLLFPAASPRPAAPETSPLLIFVTWADGPLNTFPSLHAGCLVYNLGLVRRLFGQRVPMAVTAALWTWGVFILYATLATKQHYAVDLLGGGLLGWAADQVAWRGVSSGARDSMKSRRNSEVASQAGSR